MTVVIPRSTGDQTGQGATGAMLARPDSPYCPVRALERWLAVGGRREGAVFVALQASRHCHAPGTQRLSEQAVARVVKRAATLAKLPGDFSSHSLRRGLITSAFDAAEPSERIRTHARHRSIDTTLGYADQSLVLGEHPGATLLGGTGVLADRPNGMAVLEPPDPDDERLDNAVPDGAVG